MATHVHTLPALAGNVTDTEHQPEKTFTAAVSPQRRAVLAAIVAALASPAVANATAPDSDADADLIAACREFDDLERQRLSYFWGGENYIPDENERDVVCSEIDTWQSPIIQRLCSTRATTQAGHIARARSLLWCDPEIKVGNAENEDTPWHERILSALLRDLLGEMPV